MKIDSQKIDLTLLSNFLHQVINPLNGVCGTLDNFLEGQIPKGSETQRLRAARAQLEHCITLTRNLAFFSQFSMNPSEFKASKQKTSVVPQVIIEAMMFFQESARKKGMNIHLEDPKTQYKLPCDPDLLRQVFMNIFDNAVKYGAPNTVIRVTTGIQNSTKDTVIEVSGMSVPVPRSERDRIFDVGYRGTNASEIIASGTGLGLYICKMIVEEVYGGKIGYRTQKSATESVFTIKLPGGWI
jgi:signal transduction histidine kinase